ncbi:MAG: 2-methylfumaryl-CoA hydratase [Rhodospirillaceae bacterium]|nr:2-methylfumaryl-CoA hydratase [Rhodospirillaceae bacterium]
MTATKTNPGRFFEDFRIGQTIRHATPRTVGSAERALYIALTGSRFALASADDFARRLKLPSAPLDDILVFHLIFGRSVPDISLNAVANLGYADGRFGAAVYEGDTLSASSTVIGIKENSNRETGVVYVRTTGVNQRGEMVLDYVRWVMLRKRERASPAPDPVIPPLTKSVPAEALRLPEVLDLADYDADLAGSTHRWDDYAVGEKIDHIDGMTVEESCHMIATRLYQNTAKVHFNQHTEKDGRFGRRIVYGGHVISLARALSFNGLGNAFRVAAINGGRHVNPCFAGDTVYAWSEVTEKLELPGRRDAGALRLRTIANKDRSCADYPTEGSDLLLELDYTVILPRR